jgi:hypothetical protein
MSATLVVVVLFLFISTIVALQSYSPDTVWPIVRPRLESTWGEGFQNMTLNQWLPAPEVLTKGSPDCPTTLENAAGYDGGLAIKNYDLLSDWLPSQENRVASGPTSQKCYEVDWARGLEKSSYAQRTNNYRHGVAESCSAPNHDLILDFYKPKPSPGPY